MRRVFVSVTIYPLLLTVYANGAALNDQAQAAWMARDQAGQTEKAIELWQKSLAENPQQPELWIRITEALSRNVRRAPQKSEAKKWADRARDAGKSAIEKNPRSPEAYTFYAEALGQWANLHKGFSSLSLAKEAVGLLQKAIDLNPRYAYAHMLVSQFYRKAPSGISVGDKEKALKHSRLAAELEPDRAINRLAYAKALATVGQGQKAVEELQAVVKMTPRPDLIPETRSNQDEARQMLTCMGGQASKGKACAQ